MIHETRQLLLVVDDGEQVGMIAEHDGATQLQRRHFERPANDADDDFVEAPRIRRRRQQRPRTDRPVGDLDEDAVLVLGDESWTSSHRKS
ncbi:MAG: hypothetical protein V3T72_17855 [Thermoanaerobaculia bacterium]